MIHYRLLSFRGYLYDGSRPSNGEESSPSNHEPVLLQNLKAQIKGTLWEIDRYHQFGERNRGVEPRTRVNPFITKPTRHRFTQEELTKGRQRGNIRRWGTNQLLNPILQDDPAIKRYLAHIAARRGNVGKVSRTSQIVSCSAPRAFLEYLGLPKGRKEGRAATRPTLWLRGSGSCHHIRGGGLGHLLP